MSSNQFESLPSAEVQSHLSTTLAGQQENCRVRPVKGRSPIELEHGGERLGADVVDSMVQETCDRESVPHGLMRMALR
jgi:hypothetical protein